jgi:hypothetical protein
MAKDTSFYGELPTGAVFRKADGSGSWFRKGEDEPVLCGSEEFEGFGLWSVDDDEQVIPL